MDGGSVLSPLMRVRLRPSMAMTTLLDPRQAPTRVPARWKFHEEADLERLVVGNVIWLTVTGVSAGLPLAGWKAAWDNDLIDIEKRIGGVWVEINDTDWGVLNATKA